ncbi:hypothetical protein M413DRAFT_438880 [Hebeloma cylindrosporum]|uniref:Methyltransferase domain-containing protein n=1 Tax=Hebeloma cylindrosporum TaxID=76867 RepID=A0A0C2YIZ8_HEBCY|nr:hypothetical protein M413DRAFT_438880 [Hebeloma cylindrosporum h7]
MAHHHHHEGHHHHEQTHVEHKDYVTSNKEHFDAQATSVADNPIWVELARRCAQNMLDVYPFNEESTIVMDFACNVGLLSRALAPHAKSIVGVDISQKSVDVYNDTVSKQGLNPDEMRAVCVELKGEAGELDDLKFDVVACASSYHHFASIDDITRMLAFFLKPGGVLLVTDFTRTEAQKASAGSSALIDEKYSHLVPHTNGMTEEGLRKAFDGAGLTSFEFKHLSTLTLHGAEGTLFLAKGVKPSI